MTFAISNNCLGNLSWVVKDHLIRDFWRINF